MKEKIMTALMGTNINNIVLNCVGKLKMVARYVDEKIDDGLDDGNYLMMRSYDLTNRDGDKYYVRCYYPSNTDEITALDVEEIERTYTDDVKVAKELAFCPILRVIVPTGGVNGYTEEEYAELIAREKLQSWTKAEIIDWVMENLEDVMESYEKYDANYDE